MKAKQTITRRDFLKYSGQASFAISVGAPFLNGLDTKRRKSKVVLVRHQDAVDENRNLNPKILKQMLDDAIQVLFDTDSAIKGWQKLFDEKDVVGVKSNVWGPLPTPAPLEERIVENLKQLGISEKNIAVDDRGVRENPVFQRATGMVNIRPMRTHHWAGVGSCLKNPIMFGHPPDYHPDSCANLGAVWQLPSVKGKIRLNILVMLTPLFHGIGPHHFDLKYTWSYKGILVSTDPVAVDSTGLSIIKAQRYVFFGKEKPLWPPAKHIAIADTKYKLGNSDPQNIDVIKIGWQEGRLI